MVNMVASGPKGPGLNYRANLAPLFSPSQSIFIDNAHLAYEGIIKKTIINLIITTNDFHRRIEFCMAKKSKKRKRYC